MSIAALCVSLGSLSLSLSNFNKQTLPENPRPNVDPQQLSNSDFPPQSLSENPRIDGAAVKARAELVAAGRSISAWKVLESALLMVKVDAWRSLMLPMYQVPSLHRLMLTEGKVHFTGYPGNILIPCEGEDSIKWSFINSLKEAAYIINGNCKNVMNMSQPDQVELWRSVVNGNTKVGLDLEEGRCKDVSTLNIWDLHITNKWLVSRG